MDNRPQGRDTHVTGAGKEIKKRGSGLNTGPVGSTPSHSSSQSHSSSSQHSAPRPGSYSGSRPAGRPVSQQRQAYGSGGGQRASGGRSPLLTIILAAVVLLGGGGFGLSSLFGGGGSTEPSSYTQTYAPSVNQGYTQPQGGSSGVSDLLGSLLGQGSASSFLGSSVGSYSTGWSGGSGSNTAKLNTSVDPAARAKYTKILGGGKDTVTIMVYMCGSDLESKSGMGTADLSEMASATLSDKVNLIVYTGGSKTWKNQIVSNSVNQIYQVVDGKLRCLVQNDGSAAMTNPDTLSGFIKYCAENFPANRNELILWDHGGGSISGYGYDEKNSGAGSMGLSGISKALSSGGITFDFIGFDACLMGTLESALTLTPYADYLIASEETEPGIGWYYTNWLTKLSANTSMSTPELGKLIVDDFISACDRKCAGQKTTLSVVDLAELEKTVPSKFSAFASSLSGMLENQEYKTVSDARAGTREFAVSSKVDQVDLVHLAYNLDTAESKALAETLLSAVKYNRTSSSMTNAYGVSIYFPYQKMNRVNSAANAYNAIGIDSQYTRCIQQFASVEASAQAASGGSANPLGAPLGGSGGSSSGGISSDFLGSMLGSFLGGGTSAGVSGLNSSNSGFLGRGLSQEDISAYLSSHQFDPSALVWKNNGSGYVMELSEQQWSMVHDLVLNVFYDDGEGFIDLGLDNVFSFTESGALKGEYNGTWLAIDSQPVPYYYIDTVLDGDSYVITGRVPILLNDSRADLILVFDNSHPYGYIAGARSDYRDGETETVAKSIDELEIGDRIDFICDYYNYDGSYENSYLIGDTLVYSGREEISNVYIDASSAVATYLFTDIYNQSYWTPVIP